MNRSTGPFQTTTELHELFVAKGNVGNRLRQSHLPSQEATRAGVSQDWLPKRHIVRGTEHGLALILLMSRHQISRGGRALKQRCSCVGLSQ
ncbi:hypothetical protein ACVWY3_005021 [Bradyrhizobium sp. USDA 4486]